MNEWAGGYPDSLVTLDSALEREFEDRLRDSTPLAFKVAYGVLRHRQDAEDVAQEALARAHRRFHQLRDPECFRAWLVRVTWRLAIDSRRSEKRRERREQHAIDPVPPMTAEDDLVARERSAHLWSAIDELPEKLRLVIVLAGIGGHSIRDVAELLDLPEGTVKSRLFQARKALAESLRWIVNSSATR